MTADDLRRDDERLDDVLQAYVDGTLGDKDALRVNLRAQADPGLEARVTETRAFFAALDAMPHDEPSASFDDRILKAVPLERYRTAPRKRRPVIVIGDLAPSRLVRTVQSMGKASIALGVAYLLTLGFVGVTALAIGGGIGVAGLVALTAHRRRAAASPR